MMPIGEAEKTWRDALESAMAQRRVLAGYALQPAESLGPAPIDRVFLDSCRDAFAKLTRLLGQGVIAVVSPLRGEGRSAVAAGLALALAHDIEQRVLLVDLDLQQPGQGSLFEVRDRPGLVDYLEQGARLRLVGGGPGRRLWLLTAGSNGGANVARLAHLLKEGAFFSACRQVFVWTVIDLPPLLESVEASFLADQADACVLVGRYRRTSIRALSRASALIAAARPTGFLLAANGSRIPRWIRNLL